MNSTSGVVCKSCGAALHPDTGAKVCRCEWCGTLQTVVWDNSEKIRGLYARAERQMELCDFDKAAGIFSLILAEEPREATAWWSLALCEFGISYVKDPQSAKMVPTCHRTSTQCFTDSENYRNALEWADVVARRLYQEEGQKIEATRRRILEISALEKPYDIFICYKERDDLERRTPDSVLAQDIYTNLTNRGYRVFFSRISLEDKLGVEYEPYIFAALNTAPVMIVVASDYEYVNSVWVKNEWSRFLKKLAAGEKKDLIFCYRDMDKYDIPKEFARLPRMDMNTTGAMQDLLRGVDKVLPRQTQQTVLGVASFLRRAKLLMEEKDWESAEDYYDKVLTVDSGCAEAWLGKFLACMNIPDISLLVKKYDLVMANPWFQNALRLARGELKLELELFLEDAQRYQLRNRLLRVTRIAFDRARTARERAMRQEREARERAEREEREEAERVRAQKAKAVWDAFHKDTSTKPNRLYEAGHQGNQEQWNQYNKLHSKRNRHFTDHFYHGWFYTFILLVIALGGALVGLYFGEFIYVSEELVTYAMAGWLIGLAGILTYKLLDGFRFIPFVIICAVLGGGLTLLDNILGNWTWTLFAITALIAFISYIRQLITKGKDRAYEDAQDRERFYVERELMPAFEAYVRKIQKQYIPKLGKKNVNGALKQLVDQYEDPEFRKEYLIPAIYPIIEVEEEE